MTSDGRNSRDYGGQKRTGSEAFRLLTPHSTSYGKNAHEGYFTSGGLTKVMTKEQMKKLTIQGLDTQTKFVTS